jgi:hypothetical protein
VQNEITGRIAHVRAHELVDAESLRGRRERPDSPDAVDLSMRGWSIFLKPRARENNVAARSLFEQALGIECQLVDALVGLAVINANDVVNKITAAPRPRSNYGKQRSLLPRPSIASQRLLWLYRLYQD